MRRIAIALVAAAAVGCESKTPPPAPTGGAPAQTGQAGSDAAAAAVRAADVGEPLRPVDGGVDGGWFGLSVEEIDHVLDGTSGNVRTAVVAAGAAAAWVALAPYHPTSVADLNKPSSTAPSGLAEHVGGRIRLAVEAEGKKIPLVAFDRTAKCSDGFLEVPEHPSGTKVRHEPVWWSFPGSVPEQTVALSLGARNVGAWHWNAERGCVSQTDLTAMLLGPEANAIDRRPEEWPSEELGKPTAVKEWSWKVGQPPVTGSFELGGVPHQLVMGTDRWALLDGESQPIAEFRPKPKMPGCSADVERQTYGDRVFVHLSGVAGEDDCHGEKSDLHEFGVLAEWRDGRLLVHVSGQRVSASWTYEGWMEGEWKLRREVQRWLFERETTGSEMAELEPIVEGEVDQCLDVYDRKWATKWTVRLDNAILFSTTAVENLSTRFVDGCP